ncbi:hypothetical protein [Streptosporangium sp. NPDC049644]|uniref:hypothetical protein n=1 Tax=Streptosporangium sp. NPDC049644 TaxID=3155507 RepID=UPI00341F2BD9
MTVWHDGAEVINVWLGTADARTGRVWSEALPWLSGASFGHDGAGGQAGFADPAHHVGFGYLTIRAHPEAQLALVGEGGRHQWSTPGRRPALTAQYVARPPLMS